MLRVKQNVPTVEHIPCYKGIIAAEYNNQCRYTYKKYITNTSHVINDLLDHSLSEQVMLVKVSDRYTITKNGTTFHICVDNITFPNTSTPHQYIEIECADPCSDGDCKKVLHNIATIAETLGLTDVEPHCNITLARQHLQKTS